MAFKNFRRKIIIQIFDQVQLKSIFKFKTTFLSFVFYILSITLLFGGVSFYIFYSFPFLVENYIPGLYWDNKHKENINRLKKLDSLEAITNFNEYYLRAMQKITPVPLINQLLEANKVDSIIQRKIKLSQPVLGVVSNKFSKDENHLGLDIATDKDAIIKSVLPGTIIFTSSTKETGFVVIIQHYNSWITVYKHCSSILKKQGESVFEGEDIAISGNLGEFQIGGPHLHLEIWANGTYLDPENFLNYNYK